jgi:hypothetical protein
VTVLLLALTALGGILVLASETLGLLIAGGRWVMLAVVSVGDAGVRMILVLGLVAFWPSPVGYVLGLVGGLLVFLPLMLDGLWRFGSEARFGHRRFLASAGSAMATTACLGVLSVGMPALVQFFEPAPLSATAPLFASLTLIRSPVLMVEAVLRPLVVRHAVNADTVFERQNRQRLLGRVLAAFCGVTGAAWLAGPVAVELVFGNEFRPSSLQAAVMAASGALLVALTVSGTVLVGRGRQHVALIGWLVATAATVVLLAVPATFETRTAAALLAGPVTGLAVHVLLARPQSDQAHG